MTYNSSFNHSNTPILEAWLIKALRLVYSKKSADKDKLLKMYKDARDNESSLLHITLADAMRELKEPSNLTDSGNNVSFFLLILMKILEKFIHLFILCMNYILIFIKRLSFEILLEWYFVIIFIEYFQRNVVYVQIIRQFFFETK